MSEISNNSIPTEINPRIESAYYEKVEQQIGVVKNLWDTASNFEPASPTDTEEMIQDEPSQLRSVFNNALVSFPDTAILYHKYKNLKSVSRRRSLSNDERSSASIAAGELGKKPGVDFLLQLEKGIDGLIRRRSLIRETYQSIGDGWDKPESYARIRSNRDLPKRARSSLNFLPRRKFDVIAIKPGNFSISLVLDYDFYEDMIGSSKGMHRPSGIWNFLKENEPEEALLHAIFNPDSTKDSHWIPEIAAKHEDFHGFLDSFKVLRGETIIGEEAADRIYNHVQASMGRVQENYVMSLLNNIVDTAHEELLAEIFSTPRDSNLHAEIPSTSFASHITKSKSLFERLRGLDPKIDQIIDNEYDKLNLEKWREQIQGLYRRVSERCPDKLDDLDIAFALFPPTKMDMIEKLVDRWANGDK